jgi:nucleoside 2-deoxyribosyltransferase
VASCRLYKNCPRQKQALFTLVDIGVKLIHKNPGHEIEEEISENLKRAGLVYRKDVYVSGSAADFYVESPQGGTVVLNVKNWPLAELTPYVASKLADSYKNASGTDFSFIVTPNYPNGINIPGIVAVDDISKVINKLPPKMNVTKPIVQIDKTNKKVFAAMPFSENYFDTFAVAFDPACFQINAKCIRIDHKAYTGNVVSEIKKEISESKYVLADLSESRPNVLFEIGYAAALGIPVIQVCSTNLGKLPFDVRNENTIKYRKGATIKLRDILIEKLKTIVLQ